MSKMTLNLVGFPCEATFVPRTANKRGSIRSARFFTALSVGMDTVFWGVVTRPSVCGVHFSRVAINTHFPVSLGVRVRLPGCTPITLLTRFVIVITVGFALLFRRCRDFLAFFCTLLPSFWDERQQHFIY